MSTNDPMFWVMVIIAASFIVIAIAMIAIAVFVSRAVKSVNRVEEKVEPLIARITAMSEQGKEIDERKGEIFRSRYLPQLDSTPGTRDLLQRLKRDGYVLVVATSANADDVEGLLKRAKVDDLIERATSAEEVDASKPSPDVVHAALDEAGVGPEEAVMIGDTPYDVEAATRAGVQIIAVRTGGWEADDLEGAIAVYDDPADLLRNYEDTPFGRWMANSRT